MSAKADGVSLRARAAEQIFPGQKHGKVIFLLSNEVRQGFLSIKCSFFHYLSLSLQLFIRSRLTIMWFRQDLMCIIPCPIYLPFYHKALWQSRQLKFFKNYDLKHPPFGDTCANIGFSFINECSSFLRQSQSAWIWTSEYQKQKARLKMEYNIHLKARSLLPKDSTSKISGYS